MDGSHRRKRPDSIRRPSHAVTVIVPALPGLPFSPQRPRLDEQTHELWYRLMTDHLGFSRYTAHGGDLGAGITSRLAQAYPEEVAGIHLLAVAPPFHVDEATITEEEREHLDRVNAWVTAEGAYQHQQQTRPLTLAPALPDSPTGLLSWILEKHRGWRRLRRECLNTIQRRLPPHARFGLLVHELHRHVVPPLLRVRCRLHHSR